MDIRVPLGATFAAILVVPLGWQLMNQTALTPPGAAGSAETVREAEPARAEDVAAAPPLNVAPAEAARDFADAEFSPPPTQVTQSMGTVSEDRVRMSTVPPLPSPQHMLMHPGFLAGDSFTGFDEGGIKLTANEPVSTFSVDVDTAAYAYVRRMLGMGQLPPADAVRVEELINYFAYDYAPPEAGVPLAPSIFVHPAPWNAESRLVHIGIKGEALEMSAVPPANLVLLIDTSGSMDGPDRLPLLKRAFSLLVNEMGAEDTVSIVTYAGSAGVALEPTPGSEKARILAALESLVASGSTAGSRGIETAYALAAQSMVEGGTNRVLLATDGDFNVGISDPQALEAFITQKRDEGISLSVLGFGTGNYNDAAMQALAQAGNGNAAYIDSFSEARKVLVEEMGGTLHTIASDVKVQVEFNPATVSEYRLIGYETRALAREDFNNDRVDAGDVGAGHSVTALYEIIPVGARGSIDPLRYGEAGAVAADPDSDEYGFVKIRYKAPGSEASELIEAPIAISEGYETLAALPQDIRFATAVAAFGQKLRGSGHLHTMDWQAIRDLAQGARGADETGRRAEFVRLVDIAASLTQN